MKKIFILKSALVFVLSILLFSSVKYIFLNDFLQLVSYEKVWVHRVNSIEKLKESQEKFQGVELDIVFNESTGLFDVNHPPAPSINLSLNEYFQENKSDLKYWLDFKNLNKENQKQSLDRLNKICKKHQINIKNVIVESPQIKLLSIFKSMGFSISYYYHWPGLFSLNEKEKENHINYIKKQIANDSEIILSSDFKDYKILKNHFPERTKMFWTTKKVLTFKEIYTLIEIIKDDKVKSLLIKYNAKAKHR